MNDIERAAVTLIRKEKTQWEDATCYVTDKIAFNLRPLIRLLRKNYWGIFDNPVDKHTGRRKVWSPLTEVMVESVVKSIDLDQKDIRFRAKNKKGQSTTELLRQYVKEKLSRMFFGELLDETERQLSIDGTTVWKIIETVEDGRKGFKLKLVDLLNFYIDPTARNIQETGAVIERAVLTVDELKSMDGWERTDQVKGRNDINRNDPNTNQFQGNSGEAPLAEVWERWGLMPKSLITGKREDETVFIEGHIVASNIDTDPVVHLIEKNTKGVKPYEECWYTRVAGRWYGRGIAEKVMHLQVWVNENINLRRNRAYVSQLGIFTIRKNSGITPQQLSHLISNGVLTVNNHDDIQNFPVQEAGATSYQDEEVIKDWAQRLTSAFDVVTGENLPSSTPATNAVIQDRNAHSAFVMVKEGIGMFLQRVFDRHVLSVVAKSIKKKDIIRFATDDEGMSEIIERVVSYMAREEILKRWQHGIILSPEEVQAATDVARDRLSRQPDMFIEVVEDIIADNVDTQVYVTNEEIDVGVTVSNLINMMSIAPEMRQPLVKEVFNLLGIKMPPMPLQQQQPQPSQQQLKINPQNLQQLTTEANTAL